MCVPSLSSNITLSEIIIELNSNKRPMQLMPKVQIIGTLQLAHMLYEIVKLDICQDLQLFFSNSFSYLKHIMAPANLDCTSKR